MLYEKQQSCVRGGNALGRNQAGLEEEKAGILVTGAARQQGLRTGQTVGSHRVCPTVHITALGVSEMTMSPSDLVGFHPEA